MAKKKRDKNKDLSHQTTSPLNAEETNPTKTGSNPCAPEGYAVPTLLVTPVVLLIL